QSRPQYGHRRRTKLVGVHQPDESRDTETCQRETKYMASGSLELLRRAVYVHKPAQVRTTLGKMAPAWFQARVQTRRTPPAARCGDPLRKIQGGCMRASGSFRPLQQSKYGDKGLSVLPTTRLPNSEIYARLIR
ncbi:hypothetical protein FRC08_002525, partial [Ceratobasidium sp. 394]